MGALFDDKSEAKLLLCLLGIYIRGCWLALSFKIYIICNGGGLNHFLDEKQVATLYTYPLCRISRLPHEELNYFRCATRPGEFVIFRMITRFVCCCCCNERGQKGYIFAVSLRKIFN